MKKSRGAIMLFVLPTADLLAEPEITVKTLAKAQLSLKDLTEAVLAQWALHESGDALAGIHLLPLDSSLVERVETAVLDIMLDEEVLTWLSPEEMSAIIHLIRSFTHAMFETVIPLLEQMNLTEYQLQTLKIKKWLGRSLVVDIVY